VVYSYLRLDKDEINEEDDFIVLNIFVCEALAVRTLSQSHSFPKRAVICFAVCRVQVRHWRATRDADRHLRQRLPAATET
jgi:hypothetical protein